VLQICPDGARRPGVHPALPVTPEAVAADVAAVAALGVTDAHVHPKDGNGADSLDAADVAAFVTAVRAAAPGVTVGVTTGAWAAPDPSARVATIRRWTVTPDHASVNWHEAGAEDAARALLDAGVDVHAGLFTGADVVDRFLASALRGRVTRVLVEITEAAVAAGLRGAEQVLARLAGLDVAVLLHGEDATCWPALVRAAELGLDARIGLEDTLLLPDGTVAAGNVDLAEHAVALLVG
jgi:uncharacterized protein (DUF849 family)